MIKYTNHLINESSPYLLQHAHNPVNWYPWGDEVLEKARKENKLLLISIGYSACHWCHVMEQESFEDETIAKYMNENFVSVKVDREERPDIDQIYMNAVQLISGRGGWPLNCVALPDGRPIYGGTYFPSSHWLEMLKQVCQYVKKYPGETEEQARKLTAGIQSDGNISIVPEFSDHSNDNLDYIFTVLNNQIDYKHGGYSGVPKFPLPLSWQFLLQYYYLSKNEKAYEALSTTLQKIAAGGIYDHIGGGFARYATDAKWKVPHFEKMLYDNAQLLSLYSMAYQVFNNDVYMQVVEETLEFIGREMRNEDGTFYSSIDADSEGVEGKFYVWTEKELNFILGNDAKIVNDYFSVSEKGNWEDAYNILHITESRAHISGKYDIAKTKLEIILANAKKNLLKERNKRVRPGFDDKILTAWNALMLKAYIDAYKAFGDQSNLKNALKCAAFIKEKMTSEDYRLSRVYKNGHKSINAFLDDYAFTISSYISLYQVTFEEDWLYSANKLCSYVIDHFHDDAGNMFYYTSNIDPKLIARKIELTDNVIPSANSEMAKNLYLLGTYYYNEDYIRMAEKMLNNVKQQALNGGAYFANWDILLAWFANDLFEVVITGTEAIKVLKEFNKHYLPDTLFLGGKSEGDLILMKNKFVKGQTTIYVCRGKQCQLPTRDINEALKMLGVKPVQ